MKLLQIDSSARMSSVSRELTTEFTEWKRKRPGGDLAGLSKLAALETISHVAAQ